MPAPGDPAERNEPALVLSAEHTAITALLADLRAGKKDAFDEILPLVYNELRRSAHRELAARPSDTLSTTALVHELYLKFTRTQHADWQNRAHFLGVASVAMRHILVDRARRRRAGKRGGLQVAVTLDEGLVGTDPHAESLLELHEALEQLAALDPRLARVVECRFFGGMTEVETAEALSVTERTVRRDWVKARGLLLRALGPDADARARSHPDDDVAIMTAGDALSREHWVKIEPLLDALLELNPEQQALYLEEMRQRDPAMWKELASLLHDCEHNDQFLSAPAAITFASLLTDRLPAVPMELGPYKLIREIGRGGMATVYLADDSKHGRQVAVKVLHGDVARRIGHKRFLREIEIAAGLSHPHILPLHDSGEVTGETADPEDEDRILFFVSPYVAGETLRDLLLRDGAMPATDVARIGDEIAMALEYAHRQGVVHLDIKPANILLQEGHAIIADFGIARAMSSATEESPIPAPRMGTPAYMSPEQAAGAHDIDGRSDVFSLGCVLYELAMGERPERVAASRSVRVSFDTGALRARTSPRFAKVVARATAVAREDRFASAGDLALALRESTLPERRLTTRGRRALYLAAVVLVAGGGVLAGLRYRSVGENAVASISDEKSIAVLPFTNASADTAQSYLADGLTEDLIKLLGRSRDMRVSAPTSAFKFRDAQADARDIGRQLHVAFLLRGSVHQQDSMLHVTAALIRAADGRAMWSATFDRKREDVFAVQNEIAVNAVKALKTTLLGNALTSNSRVRSSTAYNLVLRGRYLLSESTQENLVQAVSLFNQALIEEPRNARAYVGLARAYRQQAGQGWIPVAAGYAQSREVARRAIAVDPQLADGYEALAWVQSTYDWNWDAAQASYARALELEPGNAETLRTAGLLMMRLGRYDEAIIGLRRAIERDPLAGTYSNLSYALGAADRWDEAETAARTALVLGPNSILRHFNLARALLFQGKNEEALREARLEKRESWRLMGLAVVYHALGRQHESDSALAEYAEKYANTSAMQIAEVHAYRGHANLAFAWLERAQRAT